MSGSGGGEQLPAITGMQIAGTTMLPNIERRRTNRTAPPGVGTSDRSHSEDSLYLVGAGHGGGAGGAGSYYTNGASGSSSSYSSSGGHHHHPSSAFLDISQAFGACVKVFCNAVAPCYALPWVRGEESHTTGSGFAVQLPSGDRRILTHAAALENYTLVQVRRVSEAQKYVARVESYGYDVDVAVLQVDDEQFWRHMPLLELPNGLPLPMSEVVAAGFPAGGEELSTTRGIVNRVLLGGVTRELCVQMDAAINPGTSGGPVFSLSGHVIGMACSGSHQQHTAGYTAGYIIPLPVVHTFLENMRIAALAGHGYLGKSVDHYRVQPLENPELREHLGLPARPVEGQEGGVLLSKIGEDAACLGVLAEGDVLLAVDGVPIAADGTVVLPEAPSVRVGMRHCVQRVPLGTRIEYLVQRAGERLTLHVEATTRKPRLLPPRLPVPQPEWLVVGGLVFTPLLPEYECLVPKSKLQAIHGPPSAECRQVVMLLRVLQSEVNIGYEDICGMLETFNGEAVASLAHLARLTEGSRAAGAELLEFMLVTGELLVLDAPSCWATEGQIFETHSIPSRCSFDPEAVNDDVDSMLAVLPAKAQGAASGA